MSSSSGNYNRRKFLGSSLAAITGSLAASIPAHSSSNNLIQGSSITPNTILIQNGFVITMDSKRTVYPKGQVLIKDGKITGVGNRRRH